MQLERNDEGSSWNCPFVLRLTLASLAFILHSPFLRAEPIQQESEQPTGNINLYFGLKSLSDRYFTSDGTENQPEFAGTFDFRNQDWPINVLVGYFRSTKSNVIDSYIPVLGTGKIHGTDRTEEIRFGFRKIWDHGSIVQVFMGAGVADIRLHSEAYFTRPFFTSSTVKVDESDIGFWGDLGVGVRLSDHYNLGFSVSYSQARVEVADESVEVGGDHLLAFVGYHW